MQAIIGVDVGFPNSTARATLEGVGITAWEQNNDGTITPYTDVSTDVSQQPIYVSRMRTYIMFTAAQRVDQTRNGPNDDVLGDTERTIIKGWLQELKDNRKKDHIFYPCINDFALLDDSTQNSTASLANGDRTVAIQVALIASQRRLFLSGDISTTTTITLPIT